MNDLSKLIGECITPAAVDHKIKFYLHHSVKDEVVFWSNLETYMSKYIESEVRSSRIPGSSVAGSFGLGNCSYLDERIQRIKSTYNAIRELRESLTGNGECTYEADFKEVTKFNTHYLKGLKNDLDNNNEWKLEETKGDGNFWDWKLFKRIHKVMTFHRLIHDDGTTITFDLPEIDHPNVHAQMFCIPAPHQGNYFYVKKRFQFCFEALCVNRNLKMMQSPCLMKEMPNAEIRNTGDDWRFKSGDLKDDNADANRLMVMWLRIGGIRPKIENDDPNNLYFVSPRYAEEVKSKYMKISGSNPFRYIKRSLYTKDLEVKLLEDI